MTSITSKNYAPQWQTTAWLGLACVAGLATKRWGRLAEYSKKARFLIGASPFLGMAALSTYVPVKRSRKLNCEVITVQPKGEGFAQPSFLSRFVERLARPVARLPLYPASVVPMGLAEENLEKIAIESPQFRGSKVTHLLHGEWVTPPNPKDSKTVAILFGGNGFIANHMYSYAKRYLAEGIHVMMVDPRGFGRSEGSPNAPGTQLDVEAMVEAAVKKGAEKLIFQGISLGAHHAAVGAAYAAEHHHDKVAACFMEQPFGKLSGAVENMFGRPRFAQFVQWLYPYDNPDVIGRLLEAAPQVKIRIYRGSWDRMMNPRGAAVTNENPDNNVDPIFQVIHQKRSMVQKSDVITDQECVRHCGSDWWWQSDRAWQAELRKALGESS